MSSGVSSIAGTVTVASGAQACSGEIELALAIMGVTKAKMVATSKAYLTQAVPSFIKRTRLMIRVSEAIKTLFGGRNQITTELRFSVNRFTQ
ncbi:MAG: hypothetical protein ACLP5V_06050 [Candidatus Bathyarchaeia archaeon]